MDIKKIVAKLPTGYAEDASGMNGEQLRAEIIKAETALHEVEKELKSDEKLQAARELVKDLVGAYNDVKKAQRAKIAYSLHLLEERGELGVGSLSDEDAVTSEQPKRSARPASGKRNSRAA